MIEVGAALVGMHLEICQALVRRGCHLWVQRVELEYHLVWGASRTPLLAHYGPIDRHAEGLGDLCQDHIFSGTGAEIHPYHPRDYVSESQSGVVY